MVQYLIDLPYASACSRPAAYQNPSLQRIKIQAYTGGTYLFQSTTLSTQIRRGGMTVKTYRAQRKITIPP